MEEHKDLTAEINALVQNSGKKKISSEKKRKLEITIDKKKSSTKSIHGEMSIVTEEKFLDGSVEKNVHDKHGFNMQKDGDLIIENYNNQAGITHDVMKMFRDSVLSILDTAAGGKVSIPIPTRNVFQCNKKQIYIICESGRNTSIKATIEEMLFTGAAHFHVDMESWNILPKEKGARWAILEIERHVANGESVIVSGGFQYWYELMPIAVIASMYGFSVSIGRSAGQRLSIGEVIDINVVMDTFMLKREFLAQFNDDPYSSIKEFRETDRAINSLVVFPSILHKFFQR